MPAPRPLYIASVDAIALAAGVAKTVLEVATPATTGVVPTRWWLEFDGVSASAVPVKVEIGRFSAAVATATALTPARKNYGNNGLGSQCTVKHSASSEGAGTPTDLEIHRVSPTSGLFVQEVLGMEWSLGPSAFWRIRCTAPAAVNVCVGLEWTE